MVKIPNESSSIIERETNDEDISTPPDMVTNYVDTEHIRRQRKV
jgi:hypothetical protein